MRNKILGSLFLTAFACSDNAGPVIVETTRLLNTADTAGPYLVTTVVVDPDGVGGVQLIYAANGTNPVTVEMQRTTDDIFTATIPGQREATQIAYYIDASDTKGARSSDPLLAPATTYLFQIVGANLARVCQFDSQCRATEVCDRATHRCRARASSCVRDDDCGESESCNMAARACIARDRACTRSTDCLEGEVCDPTSSKCVVRAPDCGPDSTCPNGYLCDRATNHCLRFHCATDDDCGTGRVCDRATERCVAKPCVDDVECGSCRVCDRASRVCLACPVGQSCQGNECKAAGTCAGGQCPVAAPVCDPTDRECVECLVTADCATGRICDRGQRRCIGAVTCQSDGDCPASEMCNSATHECVPRPRECDANRPCPTPKACDTVTGLCVDRACTIDSQCPTGYACDPRALICKVLDRCRDDRDCPGLRCDAASGKCVACVTTTDCARGQTCNTATHTCEVVVGCPSGTDRDCIDPAKPRCDAPTKTCVQCTSNAHCGAQEVCNAQQICAPRPPGPQNLCKPCTSPTDCGTDGLCAWSDGRRTFCTARCTADADCGAGYRCNGLIDSPTCEPVSGQCAVGCTSAADCRNDEVCTNGQCELRTGRGLCEPCTTNADCGGANDNCLTNGREQFCGTACNRNNPCPTGYSCLPQPGGTARQCFPNTLECARPCTADSQCRTGETCANGQCAPSAAPRAICEACDSNAQCGSGNACIPYPNGGHCGRDCATTACPTGYFCARLQGVSQCVASNFNCGGTPPITVVDAGLPPFLDAGLPPLPFDAGIILPPWDAGIQISWDAGPEDAGTMPDDASVPPPLEDAGQQPPIDDAGTISDAGLPAPPCTEDLFESNDSVATARPLTIGYYPNLCALNDDYYSVTMSGTQGLRIEAFFTNSVGNLDLELIGTDGTTVIASSRSTGNGESITANTLAAGTYTVRVYGRAGAQNRYDLQLSYVVLPQCIDDRFEPNNSASTATPIRAGLQAGLQICAANDDYFSVAVAASRILTVTAAFTNTAGNLDLDVTSPSSRTTTSATNSNIERVRVQSTEQGSYTIRVSGRNGAQSSYTLNVQDQSGICGTCSMDQDCGEQGARCIPLPNGVGSRCGRACTETSQCPSGFNCFTQFGVNQCLPNGFQCP